MDGAVVFDVPTDSANAIQHHGRAGHRAVLSGGRVDYITRLDFLEWTVCVPMKNGTPPKTTCKNEHRM